MSQRFHSATFPARSLATHTAGFMRGGQALRRSTCFFVFSYPGIAVDAREQRVQDGVVVVTMQQDEAQEGFQEGGLRHAPQEKVQVGGAGDHLIH